MYLPLFYENAFADNQEADFANTGTEGFYWETEQREREGELERVSSKITRRL